MLESEAMNKLLEELLVRQRVSGEKWTNDYLGQGPTCSESSGEMASVKGVRSGARAGKQLGGSTLSLLSDSIICSPIPNTNSSLVC